MRIITALLWLAFSAGIGLTAQAATGAPAKRASGKWRLATTTATDGTKIITARVAADAPIRSGFGQAMPVLVLRYKGGRTAAYVLFDTYLGEDRADATVKFGAEPAEQQSWPISSDNRALIVPGDALAFMQRLKRVDSLSIGLTPPHAQPVTAKFTTTGIELVLEALFAAGMNSDG